ncbi:MAG: NTP transferase domain-containing protein [Candidatus Pacebacteria bacterium]|nr:NTP transferase domain-containing protein [Candidatus Paceibacterota bacterium]
MDIKVRKVVIFAAGKGTRLSPITSYIPKEMLPIINFPVIHYVLEESLVDGIEQVILVIKKNKSLIAEYVRDYLNRREGKKKVGLEIVYQKDTHYGTAAALIDARNHLKKEPFLTMFADSFALKRDNRLKFLLRVYRQYRAPVISLIPAGPKEACTYGMVEAEEVEKDVVSIKRLVEKPGRNLKPPAYAAPNGYLLTPGIIPYLDRLTPEKNGELSLVAAITEYLEKNKVYGSVFKGLFFEAGNQVDFVDSQTKMILERKDLKRGY